MYCFRPKPLRRRADVWLASVLLLTTAACSRSRTYSTSGGDVTVDQKGKDAGSVTVKGTDGKSATISYNQDKVPGDYPKDVPVYSPAKVVMSQTFSEKNARNLMLESTDDSGKIVDFYKKGLDSNGWKTESSVNTAQMSILNATKEHRQVMLQIGDSGGKRSIMQVVTDKQ